MKDKKATERSQYGFPKEKSRLTNPVAFYNEAIGLVDEESVMTVVYLDFRTALHISCKTIS